MSPLVKPKERLAILASLRAGVVPRAGLVHLQVGRKDEVDAVLGDLNQISDGGAAIRFVIGRYGSGKSFFLNVCRNVAFEKRLVVAQADLSLDRRLHGNGGQARRLYGELLQNLATKTKPNGGALPTVVERWVGDLQHAVHKSGGTDTDVPGAIHKKLEPLQDLVCGHDFATVITKYLEGFLSQNDGLMSAALRWLRADFATKMDARQELGVRTIIDDVAFYDHLKLLAAFVRLAGYAGLLVNIDEMGVLSHRLNNATARASNYETILRIVNDCLQGVASGIGFYFAGVDESLEDRRRGLFSYEALRTRLEASTFAKGGLKDFSGPVIRLPNLSREELFVLLDKIGEIFASGSSKNGKPTAHVIQSFMEHCSRTLGATYFQTPREVVRGFVSLLSVLEQNPGVDWRAVLGKTQIDGPNDPDPTFLEPAPEV